MFKNNSLIQLSNYTIDKNERKIKKDKLELQLSEKEINFLILFSKSTEPISKNLVLTKVWNYSSKTASKLENRLTMGPLVCLVFHCILIVFHCISSFSVVSERRDEADWEEGAPPHAAGRPL